MLTNCKVSLQELNSQGKVPHENCEKKKKAYWDIAPEICLPGEEAARAITVKEKSTHFETMQNILYNKVILSKEKDFVKMWFLILISAREREFLLTPALTIFFSNIKEKQKKQ